ncbi:MAG: transcriptional regulator [Candidatus Dormiibacter spiritus]|nr:MAG: transcriptional regulator [Candidatus Dormibacteraeota bacterium]
MYWKDHLPAHFHAQYGEHWAELTIVSGQVTQGLLPPRALRLVREWARLRQSELDQCWRQARERRQLDPIDPLP